MPSFLPDFLPSLIRLGLIALILAVAFVLAARFRHFWGTTPVAVLAGLFQVPQTILAINLSIGVFPGIAVSPGSVVFFPATMFAILLVYVLEDELEARRLIYGILLGNLTLSVLIFVGQPLFNIPGGGNHLNLDSAAAARISRVLLVGSGLLALDAIVLIRAFQWFGERVTRNVLARSLFALSLSLTIDALLFGPVAFGARPQVGMLVATGLAGKLAAAWFFSLAFVFFLPWSGALKDPSVGPKRRGRTGPITFKDRYEDLQKQAVRDGLTGVFNRAYFDLELRSQANRAQVRGDRLLLLLIDLDSFKAVNDTFGHPTGDRVLQIFGEALRTVARQNDTVCRYGGEEFAILIAGGPPSIAGGLFERTSEETRRLWEAATPPLPGAPPRFSLGGASIPEDAQTPEELLAIADQRLYASKRAGGNRLTVA